MSEDCDLSSQDILSFEEFCSRKDESRLVSKVLDEPRYNSFPLFFVPGSIIRDIVEVKPFFQKFLLEQSDLEQTLVTSISELKSNNYSSVEDNLYQAYKFMMVYGATDNDLTLNHC